MFRKLFSCFYNRLPFFGFWSHYSLEGLQVSCSVEWKEKSFNVVYILNLFNMKISR